MLRAVLVGLLAVSATSSCSSDASAPAVAPGAVAGKVIEASGNVAATRNGATRKLAAGDEIFGDDVIETAADGSLVALLHHNRARWAVQGGQRARVDESLAWKLAKQDGPAPVVEHATSAAGRDGERTAADTRATTDSSPERNRGLGGAPNGAPEAAPNAEPAAASDSRPMAVAPQAAEPESRGRSGLGGAGGGGAGGGTREGADGKTFDAASEPRAVQRRPVDATPAPQAVMPVAPLARSGEPSGGAPAGESQELRAWLVARRGELMKCLDAKTPKLALAVQVEKGAAKLELAGSPPREIRLCLTKIVAQAPASADGRASIELAK